jgi:hypothetical protein
MRLQPRALAGVGSLMSVFLTRLWREPVLLGSVVVAGINAGLFLPDWRAALTSVAAGIATGVVVRSRVTP